MKQVHDDYMELFCSQVAKIFYLFSLFGKTEELFQTLIPRIQSLGSQKGKNAHSGFGYLFLVLFAILKSSVISFSTFSKNPDLEQSNATPLLFSFPTVIEVFQDSTNFG